MVLNKDTRVAVLDYDGFVCKAYFAALADNSLDGAIDVLENLTREAIYKAKVFFDGKDFQVVKLMTGHNWKKDLYPSYKLGRKKDEYLTIFRDVIKERKDVYTMPTMEADEGIVMVHDMVKYITGSIKQCLVFSDDKDLKFYSDYYCGINIESDIKNNTNPSKKYEQMLYGDSEDSITGIPKVGEKTAHKLFTSDKYEFLPYFDKVITIYKDKSVAREECIKNLVLLIPMSFQFVDNVDFTYQHIVECILSNTDVEPTDYEKLQETFIENITDNVNLFYDAMEQIDKDKKEKQNNDN